MWISNTWGGYQSALLAEQNIEMVEFLPEENADGWADAWQMVKDTPNADCALKWLDYVISPEGQCGGGNRLLGFKSSCVEGMFEQ